MSRNKVIAIIDDYAEASGLKPSTICQYALGYGKLYSRWKRGLQMEAEVAEKLASWIAENPPQNQHAKSLGNAKSDRQEADA